MGFWAARCGLTDDHDTGTPCDGPQRDDQHAAHRDPHAPPHTVEVAWTGLDVEPLEHVTQTVTPPQ